VRISGGIAAALFATALLSAKSASANGRYPASTQIAFSTNPADTDLVVVRATFGLLISHDNGATWRWLCESALGVPSVSVEDPSIALTTNDALVVGINEGLEVSHDASGTGADDLGCDFACIGGPLAGQSIADLATAGAHAALALSSTDIFGDAGKGATLDSRVWQTRDDGVHWAQLGAALDPTVLVTTLDVAPSDPMRLYVSGTRGFGTTRIASLFVSTDGGASWTERPLPFDATKEVSVFIGAVDPFDADRVYLRSSGVSRLFVTADAGRSFQIPLTMTGQMLGFAIAPDGATVYAGSVEDGLLAASSDADAGLAFHKVSPIHVQCLATRAGELWACSDAASGFVVGVSTSGGARFTPKLQLDGVAGPIACSASAQGPLACAATANASQCAGAAFETVCQSLGGCDGGSSADASPNDPSDAGNGDGAVSLTADASTQLVSGSKSGCGCSSGTVRTSPGVATLSVLAGFAVCRKRRRSDRDRLKHR
jgi:MYXO-CTERM domain-containing protein